MVFKLPGAPGILPSLSRGQPSSVIPPEFTKFPRASCLNEPALVNKKSPDTSFLLLTTNNPLPETAISVTTPVA